MATEPAYMVTPSGVFEIINSVPYEIVPDADLRALPPGYYDDALKPVELGGQVPADIDDYDDL